MGARELIRFYLQIDYDIDGFVVYTDERAGKVLGRSDRTILNYRHELVRKGLITSTTERNPRSKHYQASLIDLNPTITLLAQRCLKKRTQQTYPSHMKNPSHGENLQQMGLYDESASEPSDDESDHKSHVKNPSEPCEENDQTVRNSLPNRAKDTSQIEGSFKVVKKTTEVVRSGLLKENDPVQAVMKAARVVVDGTEDADHVLSEHYEKPIREYIQRLGVEVLIDDLLSLVGKNIKRPLDYCMKRRDEYACKWEMMTREAAHQRTKQQTELRILDRFLQNPED